MTLHHHQQNGHQVQQSRRLIHRIFAKQYGLTLHVDAVDLLLHTLHQYGLLPIDPADHQGQDELDQTLHTIAAACPAKLDNVLQRLKNNANQSAYSSFGTPTPHNEPAQPQQQPAPTSSDAQDDIDLPSLLHILSAFHLPRWRYSPDSKAFLRIEKPSATPSAITPHAQAKPLVLRDRFELIRQRILRNPNFRPATFSSLALGGVGGTQAGAAASSRLLSLTPISALRGNEGRAFYLFGMLSRLDHGGKVFLEDGSASVELDLSQTSTGIGFFTETCFVIVQGTYTTDKVFFVHAISMPPAETRLATFEAFGQLDFLGAPVDVYDTAQLQAIEHQFAHNAIYVLSDVHLDHKPVRPFPGSYRDLWTALATMVAEFTTLTTCSTFVFVPGPTDPWNAHLHPRAPLPVTLVGKIMSKLARVELATSPCRVKYCTLEMVLGRGEYVGRMRRGDVVKVEKMRGARERAAAAALEKGKDKARPRPVMWDYDHVNRLYPLPHIVVAADAADTDAYVEEYAGVTVVNPGSFSHSGMRAAGAGVGGDEAGRFTYAKVVPGVRRVQLEAVYSSSGF
ncbi:DNA polymerase alpha/epsilon subunit B-domain-containing protein [Catenaria anguillulae PL171]|uniref:DNA polymerase epsilon subunit n=1 Tax=Catenaria anguillulae PL171 TaxID=765915 RepID=A0A1Y2HV51_9FUNG|nr:DNA polymerase alpha/epsilon subunit B-domain-containing protein [Catenaria anguillulae PL171]